MQALTIKLHRLQELFTVTPNGDLIVLVRQYRHRKYAGDIADLLDIQSGYKNVFIDGIRYKSHRVVYQLFHHIDTLDPNIMIDHIDRNTSNNNPSNLRIATHSENCYNRKVHSNNKSGHRHISWSKSNKRWSVQLRVNKKVLVIGYYDIIDDALVARNNAYLLYPEHYESHFPA